VLSLGELRKGKGTYDILAAVPLILQICPEAEFLLGGTGDSIQIEQQLSSELWGTRVRLLGWVEEHQKSELFARAKVFLLPSHSEGLPIAILEAMAHGIPVVSTEVGGIPDAVIEGATGFLIQPGDVTTLAERVSRLLSDHDLWSHFSKASIERMTRYFQVDVVLGELYAIYDVVLARDMPLRRSYPPQ